MAVQLPAPAVDEADGSTIKAGFRPQVTVRIAPYRGMAVGDKVSVHWGEGTGRCTNMLWLTEAMVATGGDILVVVPGRYVDSHVGREVPVFYTVEQARRIADSAELLLSVEE